VRATTKQFTFERRGGARRGAGRKPKGAKPLVSRRKRAKISRHVPVLVTIKIRAGLPSLRSRSAVEVIHGVFEAASSRYELRVVHFSIQATHVHMIVEAPDKLSLSRGMQGLCVRITRALNRLWGRKGSVFADRFHSQPLRSPRQTRNALCYTLNNARKHGIQLSGIDPCSSGLAFDGWRDARGLAPPLVGLPVHAPRAWLLTDGWLKHGLIGVTETPRARG